MALSLGPGAHRGDTEMPLASVSWLRFGPALATGCLGVDQQMEDFSFSQMHKMFFFFFLKN